MDSESDNYLKSVIINNKSAPVSIDDFRLSNIKNIVNSWAGNQLSEIIKSGSSAKGTAIKGVSDIDLFISLKSDTRGTLKEIYNSLDSYVKSKGISTKRQNVSLGIIQYGLAIDLVPGIKQPGYQNYHSIYESPLKTPSSNLTIFYFKIEQLVEFDHKKDETKNIAQFLTNLKQVFKKQTITGFH